MITYIYIYRVYIYIYMYMCINKDLVSVIHIIKLYFQHLFCNFFLQFFLYYLHPWFEDIEFKQSQHLLYIQVYSKRHKVELEEVRRKPQPYQIRQTSRVYQSMQVVNIYFRISIDIYLFFLSPLLSIFNLKRIKKVSEQSNLGFFLVLSNKSIPVIYIYIYIRK